MGTRAVGSWLKILPAALFLSGLFGCASSQTKGQSAFDQDLNKHMAQQHFDEAGKEIEDFKQTELYGKKNGVLFNLDKGAVLHYGRKFLESDKSLDKAENRMNELYTKSMSKMAGLLFVNDATTEYAGQPHERVMLNVFRALNWAEMGKADEALVESRKVERFLNELNQNLGGKAVYNDDAFARYLDALIYEEQGKDDDARISIEAAGKAYGAYQNLYGMRNPIPAQAKKLMEGEGELDFVHFNGPGPRKEQAYVMVRWVCTGIPLKVDQYTICTDYQEQITPIPADQATEKKAALQRALLSAAAPPDEMTMAVPVYVQDPYSIVRSEVVVDGLGSSESVLVEDISAIALKDFQSHIQATLYRTIGRAAIKKYLVVELALLGCRRLGGWKTTLCQKTAVVGLNALFAAIEKADTRSWVTLPAQIRLARVPLKAGTHQITVNFKDASGGTVTTATFNDVVITAGKRTFLTYRTDEETGGSRSMGIQPGLVLEQTNIPAVSPVPEIVVAGGGVKESLDKKVRGGPLLPDETKTEPRALSKGEAAIHDGALNLNFNYPGGGVRYFLSDRTGVEGRAQFNANNWTAGSRLYWYPASLRGSNRFSPYLCAEGDYVSYKGKSSSGTGWAGGAFGGIEYALSRSFSLQFDAGSAYFAITDKGTSLTQNEVEFILNFGVSYYLK